MRKALNRRAGDPSRKNRRNGRIRRASEEPQDAWDPFETLVIYMAASRAMEKLCAKPGRRPRDPV